VDFWCEVASGDGEQVLKRRVKPYIPDFKLAFEHVCIHTGGRGVVEEIEKQLSMTPELMQPSKDTLFRFGNTSSSSIWSAPSSARAVPAPATARVCARTRTSCLQPDRAGHRLVCLQE
jgi:hypothetical protein